MQIRCREDIPAVGKVVPVLHASHGQGAAGEVADLGGIQAGSGGPVWRSVSASWLCLHERQAPGH
jgi:hypothetical protein